MNRQRWLILAGKIGAAEYSVPIAIAVNADKESAVNARIRALCNSDPVTA